MQAAAHAKPLLAFAPALAAMSYPFWLRIAHAAPGVAQAPALLGAIAMPLSAAALWLRAVRRPPSTMFERRARQSALLALAAPPLFVFASFVLGMLGRPVPEVAAWLGLWAAVLAWVGMADARAAVGAAEPPAAMARVAHGFVAACVLAFVAFHLANHLAGWWSPRAHAAVMHLGRRLYRLPAVEAALVGLLLFQVAAGARLASRWSTRAVDGYRGVQVATGVYLGFFLLCHMNSALVSARLLHGTDTDWAWATSAPLGLLRDAWGIRLLPHYALGVFCVLAHLACGLRVVVLAHGGRPAVVDRLWGVGLALAALVAALIVSGLCGLHVAH